MKEMDQLLESSSFIGRPAWVCTSREQKALAERAG